jgi:hypothetical protein
MYLVPLNYATTMIKIINFMLGIKFTTIRRYNSYRNTEEINDTVGKIRNYRNPQNINSITSPIYIYISPFVNLIFKYAFIGQ